jgi:hypothetical protein
LVLPLVGWVSAKSKDKDMHRALAAMLVICALAVSSAAGAQDRERGWQRDRGHHYGHRRPPVVVVKPNPGEAFWGGLVGNLFGQWWWQANRPGREEAVDTDWLESCTNRYRSFDRITGTYLGYDGVRHRCVL